jgi:hypothetical protein
MERKQRLTLNLKEKMNFFHEHLPTSTPGENRTQRLPILKLSDFEG